jgi:hypothetical protein
MAGGIRSYSTTPSSNNAASPFGFPEDMAASGVNDSARQVMADVRTWYEDAQWIDYGHVPTRTGNTTFTIPTDVTAIYTVGRRVKVTGSATGYSTVSSSAFASVTTVTVVNDSGTLPATLTTVSVGIVTQSNSGAPQPLLADGSVGSPSLAFINETGSGLYRVGTNDIALTVGGTQRIELNGSTAVNIVSVPCRGTDGSSSGPGFSFTADTNTGVYRIGADNIGISVGALKIADLKLISGSDAAAAFPAAVYTPEISITFSATAMVVLCGQSNVFRTTMTSNVTTAPTFTNQQDGQTINWFITQDGTGSRTMTWPTSASFVWPGGTAGVLSTAANSVDLLVATWRATTSKWYATLTKDFK